MIPYYVLMIIPFFIAAAETMLQPNQKHFFKKKQLSNKSILVFFVIWGLMLSLRHPIKCGFDLPNYQYMFSITAELDFLDVFSFYPTERLYFTFNWLIAHIYPDFRLFLIVTSLLCSGVVGWFYYKESELAPLTILLFVTNACFVMFYSGLRQSLAMLFVIPAYYMTKQKRLVPFILIVLLAKCFHNSATVMLLLYPIYHTPLRSKHFILVILLVVFFFIFKSQIFTTVVPFLNDKYSGAVIGETNGYTVWIMFILLLVYSFLVFDDSKMDAECLGLRNILVIMTLIQGFAPIFATAMRMNYYFILIFPIIIPKLMNHPKVGYENMIQFSKWFMILLLTIFFFVSRVSSGNPSLGAYPYVAFWE